MPKFPKNNSPFMMKGYTYPGTSPLHDNEKTKKKKKSKQQKIQEEEEKELYLHRDTEFTENLPVPPDMHDGSVTDTAKNTPIRNYKKGYYGA
tara:strand:- start:31 stop:306 length:276 start_codon:yes stop_codon:yes gene_type:complete